MEAVRACERLLVLTVPPKQHSLASSSCSLYSPAAQCLADEQAAAEQRWPMRSS